MTAYGDFLADPDRIDLWIAELKPYSSAAGTTVTLRVATDEYATEPGDTPANTPYTDAPLMEGPSFDSDVAAPGTLGQLPARKGGLLTIGQRMGHADSWSAYDWDGRACTVRHGGYSPRLRRNLAFAEMGVFEYEMELAKIGLDTITIPLRDPARRFDEPLQFRRFRGTSSTLRIGPSGSTRVGFGSAAGAAGKCNLTGDFSLECRAWINSFATSETSLLGWGLGASAYPFQCYIHTNGKLRVMASNYAAAVESSFTASTKSWYSVFMGRSGSTIVFRLYEESTGVETLWTGAASATTGASSVAGTLNVGSSADAILDELRLWSGLRTEDEWRDARGRALTAAEAGSSSLKLYLPLDASSGTTVTDASSSPANGTISGSDFAWLPSLQGGADLAGKVMPDAWGYCEDANPVLVHAATQVHQCHSRNVSAFGQVSEGGAAITLQTAYTDWLAFLAASVAADGKYDSLNCTDGAFVRYRSNPSKPVSVTVSGDATGSGYVSTAADITRRIVTTRGKAPLADPAGLDTATFTALNSANSAVVGRYYADEVTIAAALKDILGSVGAVSWFGTNSRLLTVKRFGGSAGTPVKTLTEKQIASIEPLDPEQAVWELLLDYRRNYTPMTTDQMASGAIGTSRQDFLSKPTRTLRRLRNATKTRHLYAQSRPWVTFLTTEADAIAEADRILTLLANGGRPYRLELNAQGMELDRMDLVALDYKDLGASGAEQNRFDMNGTNWVILANGIRSAEGKALITVWREG